MKTHKLTQCLLTKTVNSTTQITQVVYIPSKYAVENTIIKIKNDDGTWDDHWKVTFVYTTIDDIVSARQSIKRHRKNTGDSLPKNSA